MHVILKQYLKGSLWPYNGVSEKCHPYILMFEQLVLWEYYEAFRG